MNEIDTYVYKKILFKAKEYLKTEVVILFYFDCSCEPELYSKL